MEKRSIIGKGVITKQVTGGKTGYFEEGKYGSKSRFFLETNMGGRG